jgi:hypothetical protein
LWVSNNGRKKYIKLEEEAISEILVADTASESGAKASDGFYNSFIFRVVF